MNTNGFFIRKLDFVGPDKRSSIQLKNGLNVIYGPTSTGKSFMFDSINFMLGGKDSPEEINEIIGFDKIQMEIESYAGRVYTLERAIKGGNFKKYNSELSKINPNSQFETLGSTHNAKNSISKFLLSLSGFDSIDYFVKRNKNNELNRVSFRTMIHLIMADEVRIISKNSPVYSGVRQANTKEQSMLKLLMTNEDDSSLSHEKKQNSDNTYNKVKIDLIKNIIEESKAELLVLERKKNGENNLSDDIEELSSIKDSVVIDLNELIEKKNEAWNAIQSYNAKELSIKILLKRFSLLKEQYDSDLERLLFLSEGTHYFNQLNLERCPLCQQELTSELDGHNQHIVQVVDKTEGVKAEIIKINKHLRDLEKTIMNVNKELKEVEDKKQITIKNHKIIVENIEEDLQPKLNIIIKELDDILVKQAEYNNINFIKENIKKLEGRKTTIETSDISSVSKSNKENQYQAFINDLCLEIENILNNWNVKEHKVTFDYEKYDILIEGKKRSLFGKGYRAISFSAFMLGLLEYCAANNLPHAGFVILDSPLTTYKKEDHPEEEVPEDVQNKFYNSLSESEHQVIVFENKKPQKDVIEKINYIEFTKNSNIGRYGFITM
ncbi:AAA family ATPase [Exiguobacterium sp. AT1b]|uniref:AAA family ATPase n=1 Tax=Exiguobacterium sp. (strain ATCC BAA-1283 / AT1b) TaxID=360911 RepID=UPI00093D85B9|nr:AAA family ATPase [Exiguobacterium sp. AT1b]